MVVAANAHAGRRHDQVGRRGGGQRALDRLGVVADSLQEPRLAAGLDHRGGQRQAVRVVDLPGPQRVARADELVARRQDRDDRTPADLDVADAKRGEHGQPGRRELPAQLHLVSGAGVVRGRPDERAGRDGRRDGDNAVGLVASSIGTTASAPGGKRGAGHDAERRPGLDGRQRWPRRPRSRRRREGPRAHRRRAGRSRPSTSWRMAGRRPRQRSVGSARTRPAASVSATRSTPVDRACASKRAWASSSDSIGPVQPVRFMRALMSRRIPRRVTMPSGTRLSGSTTGSCATTRAWIRCSASAIGASGPIVTRSAKRVMMSVTRAKGQSSRAAG